MSESNSLTPDQAANIAGDIVWQELVAARAKIAELERLATIRKDDLELTAADRDSCRAKIAELEARIKELERKHKELQAALANALYSPAEKQSPPTDNALLSHAKWLRQAADEIAKAGHNGWGNTCLNAAEEIERQSSPPNASLSDEQVRQIIANYQAGDAGSNGVKFLNEDIPLMLREAVMISQSSVEPRDSQWEVFVSTNNKDGERIVVRGPGGEFASFYCESDSPRAEVLRRFAASKKPAPETRDCLDCGRASAQDHCHNQYGICSRHGGQPITETEKRQPCIHRSGCVNPGVCIARGYCCASEATEAQAQDGHAHLSTYLPGCPVCERKKKQSAETRESRLEEAFAKEPERTICNDALLRLGETRDCDTCPKKFGKIDCCKDRETDDDPLGDGVPIDKRTHTPCKIAEYDGAYKCYAHNKQWGAIIDPDEPCSGWQSGETTGDKA